jgi:hypothetical protein
MSTEKEHHITDLDNAAILHVENLDLSKFTWPESYCELFEAGAKWQLQQLNFEKKSKSKKQ